MVMDSIFKELKHRKELISTLEEFVYFAEKGTPLGAGFPDFPEGRVGDLLNRLAAVYRKTIHDRTSLDAAKELVVRETQDNIRQKRQLTQNINHELKTPVSCINGYLETILRNPGLSEEQRTAFVGKCYEQSQRLSHLLADLSMITRMEEAPELVEKEEISLSELIAGVVADMQPTAEGRLEIVNRFPMGYTAMTEVAGVMASDGAGVADVAAANDVVTANDVAGVMAADDTTGVADRRIVGNHFFLYSIFRNLLENAVLYSKGSQVVISLVEETEDEYTLSVQDDGVGVDAIHLPRIFERFYRIDKGRSRRLGGTGLGLSIVKNAVALHGGTIRAVQARPSGLAFVFTLKKY